MTGSAENEPIHLRVTEDEAVLLGLDVMDELAQRHVRDGQVAEAASMYMQEVELSRETIAIVEKAGSEPSDDLRRAVDERTAHALRWLGQLEAALLRVRPALDNTAASVAAYRELDGESASPGVRRGLSDALASFAFARAFCRMEIPEAAAAIAESVRLLEQLAAQNPGEFEDELEQRARLRHQIGELLRREEEGEPLGIAGTELPDGRSDRHETQRLRRLEQVEVSDLLPELGADRAEAFLRGLDARGDAEGARKLGVLRNALGDTDEGEAALRRGDERGSVEAPFYLGLMFHERGEESAAEAAYRRGIERGSCLAAYNLGLLLRSRGDRDGAYAAFERATRSDDSELAADAHRMLRKVSRARWLRRPTKSQPRP